MKIFNFFIIISFIFFSNFLYANHKNNILYINSNNTDSPFFFNQLKGVQDVFNDKNINLDIEFMDSDQFYSEEYYDEFFYHIKYKINFLKKYDLILCSDIEAINFVKEKYDLIFKNIPVVFFGLNEDQNDLYSKSPFFYGYYEEFAISDTIQVASTLFPNANNIYAITDKTISSNENLKLFFQLEKKFNNLSFNVISLKNLSFDEFYKKISKIKKTDIVLLLSAYKDKNNTSTSFQESLENIQLNTKAPIFTICEHGLDFGVLGGKLINQYNYAFNASNVALQILNQEKDIVFKNKTARYKFDYNILKKYNVDFKKIPKNSIIINKPVLFSKKIIYTFFLFFLLFLIFIFIIISLVFTLLKIKKTKKELEESKLKYERLFEHLPISVWEEDLSIVLSEFKKLKDEGIEDIELYLNSDPIIVYRYSSMIKIININKASVLLHQAKSKDHLLNNLQKTFSNNSYKSLKQILISLWDQSNSNSLESIVRTLNGEDIHVLTSWSFYEEGKAIVSSLDITKQKKLQYKYLKAKEIAEKANKAKSDFLANMSHELRTPLTGIVGMIELLSFTNINEEQQDYLNAITFSSEKLVDTINDILDISKIESGKLELENDIFLFEDFVYSIIEPFSYNIEKKGLNFFIFIQSDLFIEYIGDSFKINQVLTNLLGNALKFTNEGFIYLKAEVLNQYKDFDEILFSITDTGVGISEDKLESIFNPFVQEDQSYSKDFQGTGLGLSISQKLVNLMGGDIKLSSTKFYGSTFSFNIKLKKNKTFEKNKNLLSKNIAIFSNNDINSNFLKEILNGAGANVIINYDYEDFFNLLSSQDFDFILIDYVEEDWDKFFSTLDKNFKICFLLKNKEKIFFERSFPDFKGFSIKKPIKRSELINLIKNNT